MKFDLLYRKSTEPFSEAYAQLYEIDAGGNYEGARRHWEAMQYCPNGYRYHGKIPRAEVVKWSSEQYTIVDVPTYTLDGDPNPDYVLLFSLEMARR